MNSTDICNMALSFLAKGRITSLDDNTEEAKQCRIHYEHCRRMILRQYNWGFAKRTVKLAKLDTTIPGWDECYAYPAECLSLRRIFNESTAADRGGEQTDYDISLVSDNTRAVLTDLDEAWAEYTIDITDVGICSEEFCESMARLLAASMAMPLTGSANIQQAQYQLYQIAVQAARLHTAQEKHEKPVWPTDYAAARFQ